MKRPDCHFTLEIRSDRVHSRSTLNALLGNAQNFVTSTNLPECQKSTEVRKSNYVCVQHQAGKLELLH